MCPCTMIQLTEEQKQDIKEAFDNIKPRCSAIIEAKGRDIHMD